MQRTRFVVLAGFVLAAAASRLLPHPPNLTPLAAMALFGGAHFPDKRAAFFVTLAAMFLSDLVIGLHRGIPVVYGCFALIVCIGMSFRGGGRRRPLAIAAAALASSILFFLITNFAVWARGVLYPRTLPGLATCYAAAIPFFRNTLIGDLAYAAILFGGFALLERRYRAIREPAALH
jgi:hypothetical protein